ncbi:MAG: folylpolyglutamate synthase/dihydrofolate synthase family protein [Dehalococcoidia bacterium]
MSAYTEAIRYLYSFANYEFTPLDRASAASLDLRRVRALLARLGDPQRGRRTVHITGSKGKGSASAMIAAILRGAGRRTGLFTSPHLHHETERYQVDGEPMPDADLVRLVEALRPHVAELNAEGQHGRLTTFELRTALTFLYFRERQVDWQVVEVGLGGRLDATNVLDEKDLCVFTPVSLEHTQILGDTVAKIAADKAGILRPGVRAVMGLQRESAAEVFRAVCKQMNASLEEVAQTCRMNPGRADMDGQEARLRTSRAEYRLRLPLLGRHQLENAATAVLAVENLRDAGVVAPPPAVAAALAEVRWPGRLEVLRRRPVLVVDGAHNADSARRLVDALGRHFQFRRVLLVVGLNRDKDRAAFAGAWAGLAPEVIAAAARIPRAAPAVAVADAFREAGMMARTAPSVAQAVDDALNEADAGDLICVTGSLYVVAEARAWVLGIAADPAELPQ